MATTDWTQEAGMTGTVDTDNIQDLIEQAETAATGAETSETNAATSATNAETSATNSAASATSSANSAAAAATSATAAQAAQTLAQTAQTDAETAETGAQTSATNAAASASSASTSASTATTQATNAQASANDAAASETAAATSETNAATSATSAATSATNAASSATAASASETAAAASETNAAASETAAATSETNAATSATTATTQATNAATSATNAATSETNAATSASSASTSATSASTSATNAATSATAAAASQTAAAASAASAANSYDAFDDRYLGTKASDPTLDNDGNALVAGALYFNSTANEMRVYDGGNWIAASSAGGASLYYYNYTATSSQTTFSGADDNANTLSYTVDNLIVTLNGVTLENGTDYTATNGTSVVLTVAASTGDELNIVAFKSFTTADMVSATNGGTFQGAVTFNAGANFGDNDKAIFGAGSDLQIYHDGSESIIKDAGTGNLKILATDLRINNADSSKSYITGVDGGYVNLYHNGQQKLVTTSTGIDVTGTVTADGLTVESAAADPAVVIGSTNNSDVSLRLRRGLNDAVTDTVLKNSSGHFYIISDNTTDPNETRAKFADNGDISFYEDTGTTAKFFWDASAESLGIGTSSPSFISTYGGLHINGQNGTTIKLTNPTTGQTSTDGFDLILGAGSSDAYLWQRENANLIFGTSATERMRIDSSGKLLVGTTSAIGTGKLAVKNNSADAIDVRVDGSWWGINQFNYNAGSQPFQAFRYGTTLIGNISGNNTSTSYNTSSDYRLKTDVQPMTGATERLKALKPVNFEWISSGERVDGFLAHEAQEVVPEAVTGTKDAMTTEEYEVTPAVLDDDGNVVTEAVMGEREVPDYQGIDQSKMTPLVVKCLQEAIERIEQLESRLAAAGIE